MMRILAMMIPLALVLTGCATFETQELSKKVDDLERRVSRIETGEDEGRISAGAAERGVTYVSDAPKAAASSKVSMSKRDTQRALKNAGYYYGAIDGKLGKRSRKAIKEFQEDHGLKVDGIAGPQTQKVLVKYLNEPRK